MDLLAHARGAPDSGYIATSSSYSIAFAFAGKNGFVYQICTKRGIDVNAALGPKSPYPEQLEVAVPSAIKGSDVMLAIPKTSGIIPTSTINNPNFDCGCNK